MANENLKAKKEAFTAKVEKQFDEIAQGLQTHVFIV